MRGWHAEPVSLVACGAATFSVHPSKYDICICCLPGVWCVVWIASLPSTAPRTHLHLRPAKRRPAADDESAGEADEGSDMSDFIVTDGEEEEERPRRKRAPGAAVTKRRAKKVRAQRGIKPIR